MMVCPDLLSMSHFALLMLCLYWSLLGLKNQWALWLRNTSANKPVLKQQACWFAGLGRRK